MLRSAEPISLQFVINETSSSRTDAGIDLAGHANADIGVFPIDFKCEVVHAGFLITEDFAGTSSYGEIRFDRRFKAGSDTGRTDGDVGRIILGNAAGANSQGDYVYDRAAADTDAGVTLEPGMEVVVQCVLAPNGEGEAGKGWPRLVVRYLPERRGNLSQMTETA
jgi:hypothetical protein